jgi:hypothetical protein
VRAHLFHVDRQTERQTDTQTDVQKKQNRKKDRYDRYYNRFPKFALSPANQWKYTSPVLMPSLHTPDHVHRHTHTATFMFAQCAVT